MPKLVLAIATLFAGYAIGTDEQPTAIDVGSEVAAPTGSFETHGDETPALIAGTRELENEDGQQNGFESYLEVVSNKAKELGVESEKIDSFTESMYAIQKNFKNSDTMNRHFIVLAETKEIEYKIWDSVIAPIAYMDIIEETDLPRSVKDTIRVGNSAQFACETKLVEKANGDFRDVNELLMSSIESLDGTTDEREFINEHGTVIFPKFTDQFLELFGKFIEESSACMPDRSLVRDPEVEAF